jgi:exopolysaccharide production protein ExoY
MDHARPPLTLAFQGTGLVAMPGLDTFSASISPETLARQTPAVALPAVQGHSALSAALKRAMDVVGAATLLVLLAPVFLALTFLVRRDGGPAFYGHQRVGQNGRMFGCLKFRSMVIDSDARLKALLASDPVARIEWEASRKLRNDPRVTAVGRFLRKTSLDELPQLINVLRGEMSLVGPRPVTATELATYYGPAASLYASVRPGITGLWQVSGRSDCSYAQRVALDVDYAANQSVWSDVKILLRTPAVVLARKGAV